MEVVQEKIQKQTLSKIPNLNVDSFKFGEYISEHMLVCDFKSGRWHSPQILPYGNFEISPSALALHYGQTVFEGMKAFKMDNGQINIFRMEKHYQRFMNSLERMGMPIMPQNIFADGLKQLVTIDKDWIPTKEGTALYIRPFLFATEAKFGLSISDEYRFIIFTGPVPPVFAHAIKVKVETHYVRAAAGGTGFAKCGGNYGASLMPTKKAKEEGFDQVLWTDSKHNKFIEEAGMMNVMFVINGTLVTPALSDSILDGVTRDSLLTLAKDNNYNVEERKISITELAEGINNGSITEAFGTGTAAIISPISLISIDKKDYQLPAYNQESMMFKLKKKLDDIRYGRAEDIYKWNSILE